MYLYPQMIGVLRSFLLLLLLRQTPLAAGQSFSCGRNDTAIKIRTWGACRPTCDCSSTGVSALVEAFVAINTTVSCRGCVLVPWCFIFATRTHL